MSEENIQIETIEQLEFYLEKWLKAYEAGNPLVTDDCYDHYKRLLLQHKPDSPLLKKIGNIPKKGKEELPYILGSLRNKTLDDIHDWYNKYATDSISVVVLSHKLDGMAIEIEFTHCNNMDAYEISNAWTRGDGYIGENITAKALRFAPLYISEPYKKLPEKIYLKGEVLLGVEPETLGYKNKRNAVAGIINRDDMSLLTNLYVIFHTWANPNIHMTTEFARLNAIQKIVGEKNCVKFQTAHSYDEMLKVASEMIDEPTQYDKDGIVICINNTQVENIKLPDKKIAFKFNKQSAITGIRYIEWNASRTGKIIPLIHIDPVDLGGATITKCAGFNAKYILENNLGKGSTIKIVRSGDVIPYIEQIIKAQGAIDGITSCPSCQGPLEWDDNEVHVICPNSSCPAKIQKKIAHFFEKLGLEEFSEKAITSLGCNSIIEVLNLTKEQIMKLDGWAETSATDFVNRINEIKKTTPEKLLAALSIENLGDTSARLLLNNFKFEEIINGIYPELKPEVVTKMILIKGLGHKKVSTIIKGLIENIDLLKQLQEAGILFETKKVGKLQNKSFCITGKLGRPRKEIEVLIERHGGIITSVNTCDYLVLGEIDDSNKLHKAEERGINIINETTLYGMIK